MVQSLPKKEDRHCMLVALEKSLVHFATPAPRETRFRHTATYLLLQGLHITAVLQIRENVEDQMKITEYDDEVAPLFCICVYRRTSGGRLVRSKPRAAGLRALLDALWMLFNCARAGVAAAGFSEVRSSL